MSGRAARRRVGRALCALFALAACVSNPYESYRREHPDWDGDYAHEGASLEEVVAGLYAPAPSEDGRITIETIELWRAQGEIATPIDFDAWRRGNAGLPPDADVIVIAQRSCKAERGLQDLDAKRVGYYLLPGLRLDGFDDYGFGKACTVKNQFRAARGSTVALEHAAAQRVAIEFGKLQLDVPQLYRRGLAYLEAGRVLEAQAVLTTAEPGFRLASERAKESAAHSETYAEAARLRAQLMRALGVKAVDVPTSGPAPR
ncbi:MAG TPA: hypothetical protein VMS55_05650 [Myxococcota bacterium]|nr:hypothetical protein [Myxococcota bacterium]